MGAAAYFVRLAWATRRLAPVTGAQGLIGRIAVVRTALDPEGYVMVEGERWLARAEPPARVDVGREVVVTRMEGLKLRVRPR